MKDLPALFKAFVCPYLAVFFGSCIGFVLVTGQAVDQMLWVLFLGALGEMGIEFGALPAVKKLRKKGLKITQQLEGGTQIHHFE